MLPAHSRVQGYENPICSKMSAAMEVDTECTDTMNCQLGILSCSDGSAEFTNNSTSVIVSVNGPMEIKMSKENIEKVTIELGYKQKSGIPSCEHRVVESYLRSVCENVILTADHPRSSITLVIKEVHDNGSFLAACMNGLSLALLDAAVPLCYIVSASSCIIDSGGKLHLGKNKEQESEAKASFTFIFENKNWEVITSHCKGRFTMEDFQNAMLKCKKDAKIVGAFIQDAVAKKFEKYNLP